MLSEWILCILCLRRLFSHQFFILFSPSRNILSVFVDKLVLVICRYVAIHLFIDLFSTFSIFCNAFFYLAFKLLSHCLCSQLFVEISIRIVNGALCSRFPVALLKLINSLKFNAFVSDSFTIWNCLFRP